MEIRTLTLINKKLFFHFTRASRLGKMMLNNLLKIGPQSLAKPAGCRNSLSFVLERYLSRGLFKDLTPNDHQADKNQSHPARMAENEFL